MAVVDDTLLHSVNVTAGLKKEGAILINTQKSAEEILPLLNGYEGKVYLINAYEVSMAALGKYFPNTPMLAAMVKISEVMEIYEFLRYLKAPQAIIDKAPSAGLFEGQTDEQEMGVTYAAIDKFLLTGEANERDRAIIDRYHARSEHKRTGAAVYQG